MKHPLSAVVAELWHRGETQFLLHAGQLKIDAKFNNSTYSTFGAECARQLGKSFWGVYKPDQICRKFSGASCRIGTAFYTDLDAIILPNFERLLATCPPKLRPKYKTIGGKFVYDNGSEIRLVGLDRNPDKMRGGRIRYVGVEEAGFVDSDTLQYTNDSVIIPAFTHEPDAQAAYISTPPETGSDHAFCEIVDDAALHDSYIKLTIFDNPMLTPARIAKIMADCGGAESVAWRREYLCERIVDTQRAIIPEWKTEFEQDFDPAKDPAFQFWHKYASLDIGVQVDKTLCIWGYYHFREQRLYIWDETDISGVKTTTKLIHSRLTEKETEIGYSAPYRRISDNSHPLLLNDLAEKGVAFAATDKQKLHEMVGEVRVWVQAGRVRVHPRCKQLIGCLRTGIWDKTRKEFERSKVYGHYDALAALVYLIRNVDQWSNPIPDWFINPDRMPMKKGSSLSPMGQQMSQLFSSPRK